MATPMLDSDLDELTHTVADSLERFTGTPLDRYNLNDRLECIILDLGIQREDG